MKKQSLKNIMEETNDYYRENKPNSLPPYSKSDILYASFSDHLESNYTDVEKNLITVSLNLTGVYNIITLKIEKNNEELNEAELMSLRNLYNALKGLNITNLLKDSVSTKTWTKIKSLTEDKPFNKNKNKI